MSTISSNPELLPGLSDIRYLIDWSEGEEEQERKSLEERVKGLKIKKVPAPPQASNFKGNTRIPRSKVLQRQEPEIEIVLENPTRDSDIRDLVKAHVKNHQDFKMSLAQNQMEEVKTALKKAMDSQKTLHKLKVSNKEIEGYMGGWNPWVQIKETFPTNPKNKDKKGKGRSSVSLGAKILDHKTTDILNDNSNVKNPSNLEAKLNRFATHVDKIHLAMIKSANKNTQATNALRDEVSKLNEYLGIMNNNINTAINKNASSLSKVESPLREEILMNMNKTEPKEDITLLIKNLSDQMSQMYTDIAQIKRSARVKPSDTPLREGMVKEEEPNLNQTLKILPPITN
ncbi:hypothetical protein BY996DRAFT_6487455 [Phakopsora pachyrhizi]|nr:hypothetical protein BY996DRAFT_6487455 [Phakopsora pachyrhizi]